ncbi:MAG TPA: hypothetical protein VGC11_16145, partial [Acidimicrobiia bacterium]
MPEPSTAATVAGAGAVTTGAVWSATVIVAWAVPLLSCASSAVNVTTVSPSGKVAGASLVSEVTP